MRDARTLIGVLLVLFVVSYVVACVDLVKAFNRAQESHNARGGYIEACGDLPGLVGDDC